jgi:hypothetical protein
MVAAVGKEIDSSVIQMRAVTEVNCVEERTRRCDIHDTCAVYISTRMRETQIACIRNFIAATQIQIDKFGC